MENIVPSPEHYLNPVVLFANAIGDHVIFTPTIRALAKMFPGRITLVALPNVVSTFFAEISFRNVIELKSKTTTLSNWNLGTQPGDIQNFDVEILEPLLQEMDLFISPNYWFSTPIENLIKAISPCAVIGIRPELQINVFQQNIHSFDQYFCIPQYLNPGLEIDEFSYPIKIEKESFGKINSFRKTLGNDKKILIVHTDTKKRKRASPEIFLDVVDRFFFFFEDYVAVIVGLGHEMELNKAQNRYRLYDLCGCTLSETFAIIEKSSLFLGVDSCMLHVADLLRKPGIGFFGPTDPVQLGFKFSTHYHVNLNDPLDAGLIVTLLQELSK